MAQNEFLPLCDVLFNIISLASYFCNIVFDLVMGYALLERGRTFWFVVTLMFVALSLTISQVVSLRWYLHTVVAHGSSSCVGSPRRCSDSGGSAGSGSTTGGSALMKRLGRAGVVALHSAQLGVLWRYFKLFLPCDLRFVKYEVRDLCMLRLVHAFCQAAPMLLVQLYLLMEDAQGSIRLDDQVGGSGGGTSAAAAAGASHHHHHHQHHHHSGGGGVGQVVGARGGAGAPGGGPAPGSPPHHLHHVVAPPSAADLREFRDLNVVSVSLSLFSVCWALASFSKNVRMHNVHKLVLTWLGVIFQLFWRLGTVSVRAICLVSYALLYHHWVLLVILLHWFCMFLWLVSPNNLFHRERLSRPRKATLCSLIAFVYVFAYINLQEANHRPKMVTFYGVMAVENSVLMYSWYSGTPGSGQTLPLTALAIFLIGLLFMFLYYRFFHVRRLKYEAGGRLNGPPLAMPLTPDTKDGYQNGTQSNGIGGCPSLQNGVVSLLTSMGGGGELLVGSANCGGGGGGSSSDQSQPALGCGSGGQLRPPPLQHHNAHHQEYSSQQPTYKPPARYRYYGGGSHHHGGIPGVFNCRFTNPYCMTKRKKKKPTSFVPPPSVGPSVPFWCRPLSNQVVESGGNGCANSTGGLSNGTAEAVPSGCGLGGGSRAGGGGATTGVVDIQQKLQEKKRQQLAELRVIEEEMLRGKLSPPLGGGGVRGDCSPHHYSPQILLAPHYLRACEESTGLPYTLPRQTRYFRRTRLGRHLRPDHYVPPANSSDGDVDSGDDNDSECWHTSIPHLPFRLQQNRVRHETKL